MIQVHFLRRGFCFSAIALAFDTRDVCLGVIDEEG